MSLYYFNLKDKTGITTDQDGTELADEEQAREHATVVAKELMRNRELKTNTWRLQVCDAERQPRFEVLFAELADNAERQADRGAVIERGNIDAQWPKSGG
jgi:hypothetical protein